MNWQEPPEILLQQAQSAFERRDFLQVQKHIDEYHHDVQNNGYSWYLLGCAVYEQKIHSLALKYLTRAIHYHPNIHAFWGQRGYIWLENKQNHLAKADFLKALELDKTVPLTWYYLAKCTYQMQDYDEAIEYIDRCLTLDPQFWDAYNLKVTLLEVVGRLDEAHHLLNGLSEKQPNNLNFKWNLSLQSIQLGNFKRGWALYQTRLYLPVMWRVNKLYDIFHKYPEKTWHRGLSLQQKTILVYAEQGLGDIFFGVRYLLTLKRMADKVIFVTANETLSMLQNMGVCEARSWLLPLPDFDYHCALLSLPEQLEDLTNGQTYLQVQPEKIASWAKKVTKKPHTLRVGLVWMGGEHTGGGDYQELNAVRNITFVELATLNHSHIDFYSLQMGSSTRGEYELQRLLHWKTSNFIDLTQDILDFSDTAALIKQLDLVISVDTSIVHLAGGLGVPVWLLNRFNGDFRWFWSRWDSPWYQSLTLYNQPKMGSWHEVLAAIKADLQTLAGDHADLRVARGMEHAKKLLDLRMEVWCARANQLQGRQKYAEALIYYDLALKISPNQVAILLNKAKALVALNRLDLALEHYARCEQLSPDTVEIYIDRAVIWVQQLNWQEALSDNLKAQALSPKDSLVWYNSAICQQELLLLEDSLKSYQKSIELAPNYLEAQLNMTSVLQELCRYDEMLPILQKLCQTKADYVLAHWNLGLLYLRLGHYALGWELYEWRFGMENFQQDHLGRSISELAKVPGLQLNRARPG
ncbi:MAG: tetratricopeptide repeat protein, partial [Gammaproteobacteria bacterium]|nr:tetratricopeptide repeat protein [Gammaproteobacteria bacterium]